MQIESAIRAYLDGHGIKQAFLSRKCGWSKQKTSAILTGKQDIKAKELQSICDVVGVPYDYFFKAVSAQDTA